MPVSNPERFPTSVLFIDGKDSDRALYADELKACSPDYQVVEATDGQSALDLYRSRRIDCVVTDLALSDKSGFEILADFVPVSSKPQVAVIVLSRIEHPRVGELARQNGAYAYFVKAHTSGEDLDGAIQDAIALVRLMPTEDGDKAISQQRLDGQTQTYSDRPFLVYANLGDEDNLVPVKQFATRKEAEDWMVMQAAERLGYYEVIRHSEFFNE